MWLAIGRIITQGLASIGIYEMVKPNEEEINVQGDYNESNPTLISIIGVLSIGLIIALYKVYKK